MEQFSFSKWLKSITIAVGIIGIIIYFVLIPLWGYYKVQDYPELANCFWPWLIFSFITGIPCFLSLLEFWKICCEIGKDNSFSKENVKSLKLISQLLIIDSIILFIGNIVLYILNMSHITIVIVMFIIMFLGIAASVVSAALSHLILRAYRMKEENDLTI